MNYSRFAVIVLICALASNFVPNMANAGQEDAQSAEQNRTLIRQVLKLIDERKLDEAFELYAIDYVYHGPDGEILDGRDGIRGLWEVFLVGFPDLNSTVEDIVTEGDKLVLRWRLEGTHTGEFMGVAPSGAKVNLRITEIFRI